MPSLEDMFHMRQSVDILISDHAVLGRPEKTITSKNGTGELRSKTKISTKAGIY